MIQFGGVTRIFDIVILRANRLLVTAVTIVTVIVSGRRWRRRIVAGIHQHAIVGVGAVIDCGAGGSLGGGGLHHHRVVVALHVRGLHDRLVRGLGG